MNDSQAEWKRTTSIRKIDQEQREQNPPPLAHSIATAARYVGATTAEVERWWRGRGH